MNAKSFVDGISERSVHLSDELVFGGLTKSGNFLLATSPGMSLKTLIQIKAMISDRIDEMKDEETE